MSGSTTVHIKLRTFPGESDDNKLCGMNGKIKKKASPDEREQSIWTTCDAVPYQSVRSISSMKSSAQLQSKADAPTHANISICMRGRGVTLAETGWAGRSGSSTGLEAELKDDTEEILSPRFLVRANGQTILCPTLE